MSLAERHAASKDKGTPNKMVRVKTPTDFAMDMDPPLASTISPAFSIIAVEVAIELTPAQVHILISRSIAGGFQFGRDFQFIFS